MPRPALTRLQATVRLKPSKAHTLKLLLAQQHTTLSQIAQQAVTQFLGKVG